MLSVESGGLSAAHHPANSMVANGCPHDGGDTMVAASLCLIRYHGNLAGELFIDHDAHEKRVHQVAMIVLHAEPLFTGRAYLRMVKG